MDTPNIRRGAGILTASALLIALCHPLPASADDPPQYWAVTGVADNDTLHMRDVPHGDSRILADI
ncbi:MAG TPA: hypothetical protein PKE13_14990, partial [Hyphomicrobium zavarzinii]|nr:hypothetical protein [Hyphomicrobium zavarzinii]